VVLVSGGSVDQRMQGGTTLLRIRPMGNDIVKVELDDNALHDGPHRLQPEVGSFGEQLIDQWCFVEIMAGLVFPVVPQQFLVKNPCRVISLHGEQRHLCARLLVVGVDEQRQQRGEEHGLVSYGSIVVITAYRNAIGTQLLGQPVKVGVAQCKDSDVLRLLAVFYLAGNVVGEYGQPLGFVTSFQRPYTEVAELLLIILMLCKLYLFFWQHASEDGNEDLVAHIDDLGV